MAAIPDPRLQQLADVVEARKVTPAAIRVVEVPAEPGRRCSGTCARSTRCSSCSTAPGTHVPDDDLETLRLELLVADRDHVERRLERVAKQAKSGDANLKKEADALERLLADLDSDKTLAEWSEGAAAGARAPQRRSR